MGKIRIMIGLVLALGVPAAALAATSDQMQNIVLAKGDHRTGTYYAAGETVTVDGDVDGDVVCAGQTVVINGSVGGDVLCAGQIVTVNGQVGGSVRSAGRTVTVNGSVGRNVTVGAQNFELGPDGNVSGEVAIGAQDLVLNGPVAHAAYLGAQEMNLKSTIGGDLNYASEKTPAFDKTKVKGQVVRHNFPTRAETEPTPAQRLGMLVYWLVAALAGAALMIWLAPRLVRTVTGTMIQRWQSSLGWGLLALFAPAALLVLALTIIGLPAAAVIFTLWVLALTTSGLFAGIAVGRILREQGDMNRQNLLIAALIGVPILVILHWLPVLRGIVAIAAGAWTLGAMLVAANRARSLG